MTTIVLIDQLFTLDEALETTRLELMFNPPGSATALDGATAQISALRTTVRTMIDGLLDSLDDITEGARHGS